MRRLRKTVTGLVVVAVWAAVLAIVPATPAAANHFCEEADDDCDAYWWDNVFGSVNITGTQPDTVITATIVTGFPTAQWVWTETGWSSSGVSGVTVSVPGEILGGSGDGWSADAIGGSFVRFTPQGEAGPPPPDRQNCGSPCGPPPGNRWTEGTTMSVTFRSSESGGQVRASFGGNLGYLGWGDTAIRHIDGRDPNRPPVADIVVVDPAGETTSASGEFTLRAGSVDPDGDTLTHDWDFGNDETSSGETVTARYDTPGNYTVTLTSTDPDDAHDEDSELLSVPAPTLSAGITLPAGDESVAVGDEFDATVTLSVQENGVGEISNIGFATMPLDMPDFLEVVGAQPTFPTRLNPGESRSQVVRLKAIAPGEGLLRSRPNGIDAAGGPALVLPGEQTVRVRRLDLDVEVDAGDDDIEIEETADGPQPEQVTVTVTVTNDNDEDIDDVQIAKQLISSLVDGTFLYVEPAAPQPFWPVDDEQPGPGAPLPDGTSDGFSLLGDVPANESVSVEYVIDVTDDGVYGLEAQILYTVDDENETSLGETEIEALPDKLAYFTSRMPEGTPDPPTFQSGDSFTVFGDVENRSNTKEIGVTALTPTIEGESMGGGYFIRDTQEFPPPGSCAAPFGGLLEPGATVPLHGQFATLESKGTRAFFQYQPTFYEFDEENNPVAIEADDLLIDNPRQQVSLRDFVLVEPPPFTLLEAFAGFSVGAGQALIAFVWEPVQFAAWVAKGVLWELPQLAVVNGAYLAKWWLTIPVEEKAAYLADVVAHALEAIDAITIEQVWGSVEAASTAINTQVEQMWADYLQNWEDGRWFEAFRVIGRVVGEIGLEIATSGALCLAHTDKAQNAVRIQDEIIQASRGVVRTQDELDAIRVGAKLADEELGAFGIPARMAQALRALAGEGFLVTWRPRNPDSLRWLERGAIQKPQPLKIKTVSELDGYLGYDVVADGGSLVLKRPNPNIDEVLAGVPSDVQELVRQRWQLRMNEWTEFTSPHAVKKRKLPDGTPVTNADGTFVYDTVLDADGNPMPNPNNYLAWDEAGKMPWPGRPLNPDGSPGANIGIDLESNGIDAPSTVWGTNKFGLDPVSGQSDTWIIKAADADGNLRRVTGDLDALDIRHADGRPLTGDEVIDLYERLNDITGLDHGETVTWRLNGQILHPSQIDILAYHGYPNGKSLVQFAPDGNARKVLLDRNLSVFSSTDPRQHYVFFRGGYLSANGALRTLRTNLDTFFPDSLNRLMLLIVPAAWLGDLIDQSDAEPGSGQCSWRYGGGSDAALMRYTGSGYEIYNGSTWNPLDVSGVCVDDGLAPASAAADSLVPAAHGGGHEIIVRPHTVIDEPLAAGATSASIFDLSEIPGLLPAGSTWFEKGQIVAIDPGGPNEEFVSLTDVAPLRWSTPLKNDHVEGEWIAVVRDPAEVLSEVEFVDVPDGLWYSDAVDWGARERIVFGTSNGIFEPHLAANRAMLITMLWRAAGSPEVDVAVPFTDVDLDAYYGAALRWAYSLGIVKGTSPTMFSPHDPATRAHVVTVLWRWLGSPAATADNPFGDVESGRFYTKAAIWAGEVGVSTGIASGVFGPYVHADRATVITLIHRALVD